MDKIVLEKLKAVNMDKIMLEKLKAVKISLSESN